VKIAFSNTFERYAEVLPAKVKATVREVINTYVKVSSIRELQTLTDTKKLKTRNENEWRTRIGDYRIVFLWDKKLQTIILVKIEKRKDIYKKK
jgi:mRNA-degrading endonuclease RelE of RelBE toxin-antitoxin system